MLGISALNLSGSIQRGKWQYGATGSSKLPLRSHFSSISLIKVLLTTQLNALNMRKAIDIIHEKVLLSQIVGGVHNDQSKRR